MELEKVVCEQLASDARKPLSLIAAAGLNPSPEHMSRLPVETTQLAERLAKRDRILVRQLVEQVRIGSTTITVELNAGALAAALHCDVLAGTPGSLPQTSRVWLIAKASWQ
jgi:hypothetical protein